MKSQKKLSFFSRFFGEEEEEEEAITSDLVGDVVDCVAGRLEEELRGDEGNNLPEVTSVFDGSAFVVVSFVVVI